MPEGRAERAGIKAYSKDVVQALILHAKQVVEGALLCLGVCLAVSLDELVIL